MEIYFATKRIQTFVDRAPVKARAHLAHVLDLLTKLGNELRLPFSRSLGGQLFELRTLGNPQLRLLYAFYKGQAVILHGFVKKTQQTPKKELEYARKILRSLTS